MPNMLELVEKAIICLDQTNVRTSYYGRLPLVAKLMGSFPKAQTLLKKKLKK